jgi:uncharacterized repeat protein (TIGR01451 family)
MKLKYYFVLILLSGLYYTSTAQIIRPFTARYSNSSVRGSIVYIANSIVSTSGVGPGNPGTGEVPPGGSSTNNGGNGIDIDVDNPAPVTKLPFNSVWNYHAANTAPANDLFGTNWKQPFYFLSPPWNVGGVGTGAGKYGYNSGQATCLPSGCLPVCTPLASCNKYTAYYFRNFVNFTLAELTTTFQTIQLNVQRDDGIVIYINGVERARDNMPAGVPVFGTLASSNIAVGAAENFTFNLSPTFFNPGINTIAVEVHTSQVKSADMSFDMQVLGLSDNGTHNSSTADLNLASCSRVLFAGLYWGAGEGSNTGSTAWITGETTCKLKLPGAPSYTTITSTQTDYHNPVLIPGFAHTGYKCFADITSLVNLTNPNGTYTVANVLSPLGINDAYGGWTIVIAYSNPALQPKNLSVFDGNAAVKSGSGNVDINISGFLTPPAGPVSCELGAVVYDGDRTSTDAYAFKQNGAPLFYDLTPTANNPTSNLNDMWNSVIAYKGVVVATRNPAFQNTLGYDANIINLPNAGNAQLSNSQTSATVRFSSPSENYIVHVLTTVVSQYNPSFSLDKLAIDLNGGVLAPGDIMRYQLTYNNVGNDASTNTIISDVLPFNTGLVPGSLRINGVPKTDISGDDQAYYDFANRKVYFYIGAGATSAAGGTVAAGSSSTVTFDVVAASSCAVLACGSTASNSARIDYIGQTSLQALYDSSGVTVGGCLTKGPTSNPIIGSCFVPKDTTLINICPSVSITLPWAKYAGYTFYSAMPFIPTNIFNPATPVTGPAVYYAYFNTGTGCTDTITIKVLRQNCPDLDEDDDGIPDYVELNIATALQDLDGDGIPNWLDLDYPGWVDNNADGLNDNFDPGADSDNDGTVNFMDNNWPGYIDSNGDGINDNFDKDKDGIPDFLDKDSDNDGIPDVVESGGVDANGDGKIDNYSDPDSDGFSQNVDASNGVAGSGNGLGRVDTDGDGIPNYLDLDSDNDGIPDVVEVYGIDANNDGKIDSFTDTDFDGLSDNIDGDVGNDGIAENSAAALLKTGADINGDGRADSYPNKNMDGDTKTNPYDLDSDSDGILDVREAGFTDANFDGRIDGALNSDGWNIGVAGLASLNLPNTDASGRANVYDIDSDNDGIPDNVEGLPTLSYLLPSGIDTDGDGIDNTYDNFAGFGGNGIQPVDTDGDTVPDYKDSDTDNDGTIDRIEGNDLNLNGFPDDNVTLTGVDTDGDGLDDRFDNNNSSVEGTSARMGNGGSISGDPTPGSITTVQHTSAPYGCATERDWRCLPYVLSCNIITFKLSEQNNNVQLNWTVLCSQEVDHFIIERSTDNQNFSTAAFVTGRPTVNENESYSAIDNISAISSDVFYYRLRTTLRNGKESISNIVMLRRVKTGSDIQILPNPVRDKLELLVNVRKSAIAKIYLLDGTGRIMDRFTETLREGSNTFMYSEPSAYPIGIYYLRAEIDGLILTRKFNVIK